MAQDALTQDAVATSEPKAWTANDSVQPKRDVWQAMRRGFRGRCPRCGEGKIFRAFLKVADNCSVCGQDFSHHRADDLPAYLVIVIVGHIIVPLALWIETDYAPPVGLQLAVYLPLTLVASLALLQPVKGAVVALQWAFRMHGFEGEADGNSGAGGAAPT
ncbi:DUF983 domain-containing protein [Bradyrhizobium prioriisuperbiae]|uniref:DUF983 domain-containing protein n=1 Tax=Bradyrhizobium prioriisuperbiae TaxID=2854389 RepID=UPI0028F1660B|nr:DUF983 domain-containing protein [Bradyrhizobium prioritasuperba]